MENVGLALSPIHYNMETDLGEIICRFARLHLRRMELANIQNARKGDVSAGRLKSTKIPGRARVSAVLFSPTIYMNFKDLRGFGFFIALLHTVSNQKNIY